MLIHKTQTLSTARSPEEPGYGPPPRLPWGCRPPGLLCVLAALAPGRLPSMPYSFSCRGLVHAFLSLWNSLSTSPPCPPAPPYTELAPGFPKSSDKMFLLPESLPAPGGGQAPWLLPSDPVLLPRPPQHRTQSSSRTHVQCLFSTSMPAPRGAGTTLTRFLANLYIPAWHGHTVGAQ